MTLLGAEYRASGDQEVQCHVAFGCASWPLVCSRTDPCILHVLFQEERSLVSRIAENNIKRKHPRF